MLLLRWLQGQREAARRVLADKGVSVMAGAQVTEMRRANNSSNGSNGSSVSSGSAASSSSSSSSSSGGEDLAKRLVYLKDKEGQQEVGVQRWTGTGCVECSGACAFSVCVCLEEHLRPVARSPAACLSITLPASHPAAHAACCSSAPFPAFADP